MVAKDQALTISPKATLTSVSPANSIRKVNHVKSPKKPWWRTALSCFGLLVWVGISVFLAQIIVGRLMLLFMDADTFIQPVWTAVFSALSYVLAMVLIIWIPPNVSVGWRLTNDRKHGRRTINGQAAPRALNREGLGLTGWPTWTDIGLAPVGFIVYLVAAGAVTALFMLFPWFDASQAQDVGFSYSLIGADRIWAFISLVVIAPIAEEIIFRGWLYGKLRHHLSHQMSKTVGIIIAILLTSLLFGLVHMQWNVGVNVFVMSIVLCALREFTGTIYAGILLHMLKNGVAFYLLYVLGSGQM